MIPQYLFGMDKAAIFEHCWEVEAERIKSEWDEHLDVTPYFYDTQIKKAQSNADICRRKAEGKE